ncbi:hypothetical protein EUTSA_v10023819mg [Eutrema salsugineum]|uniref:RNase H type-1 domain-containing protein n=1 Tax=Eutrema salsugineum TaxID=72664 RepID=V4MDM1_EUTSA|nr:hypothetical protein EUTSA_v10023819mg [Eutrema salsugineum]
MGSLAPWLCWNIWTARNNLLFSAKEFTVAEVVEKALFSLSMDHISSPLMAESLALRSALSQTAAEDIRKILVESDSLQLIRAINNCSTVFEIHGILEDILTVSSFFEAITFKFIPRCLNGTAESLAKKALYVTSPIPA